MLFSFPHTQEKKIAVLLLVFLQYNLPNLFNLDHNIYLQTHNSKLKAAYHQHTMQSNKIYKLFQREQKKSHFFTLQKAFHTNAPALKFTPNKTQMYS